MSDTVQLEIAGALADFRFNESEYQALLNGPVLQDLAKRAIRVEASAKTYASGVDGGPEVRTGRLRGSITWRPGHDTKSVYVDVGSAVEYAPYVENGTSLMEARPFLRPGLEAARTT